MRRRCKGWRCVVRLSVVAWGAVESAKVVIEVVGRE